MSETMSDRIRSVEAAWTKTMTRTLLVFLVVYSTSALFVGSALLIPRSATRLLVVLGVSLALLGLYRLHFQVFQRVAAGKPRAWPVVLTGLAVYVAAGAVIIAAASGGSGGWALVGSWTAGLGLSVATAGIRKLCQKSPGWWTMGGIAILGAAVAAGIWQSQTDWVLVSTTMAGLVGLATASLGLLGLARADPRLWTAVGLAVILTSGVAILVLAVLKVPSIAFLPSAALMALGFVPLSNGLPRVVEDSTIWRIATALLLGAGVGAVATVSFSNADWPLAWAVTVVLLAGLFAAAVVGEVIELALVLVIGAVLAGVLVDRADTSPVDPHDDAVQRLVVFGDSYISGEGASRFFSGTNVAGSDECRRTSTAYPYLVADKLGYGLDFYACSGAKTYEVVAGAAGGIVASDDPQLTQFLENEALARADGEDVRPIAAVLISVGGNDSWFGTVGQACLGPGTCDVHRNTLLRNVTDIGDRIGAVYTGIKEVVGEDVPVVAMPYPLILTEAGCDDSPLTRQEHQFLFEFTEVLNETARVEATKAGIHWFSAGIIAFQDHRICDLDELAVNVIDVEPKEGVLAARMIPTNWVHGSAHPNELGHELTAAALADWLADLLDAAENDPEVSPNPTARLTFAQIVPSDSTRVSTRSLAIPADIPCPSENLPVSVAAAPSVLGSQHVYERVALGSTVCHSQHDGLWQAIALEADDDEVTVPAWGREVAIDFDANRSSTRQVVLWQASSGIWRIDVHEYCELDPACADNEEEIKDWMVDQINKTIGSAVVPVLLMFLGAWFLAIDAKRWLLRRETVGGTATPSE